MATDRVVSGTTEDGFSNGETLDFSAMNNPYPPTKQSHLGRIEYGEVEKRDEQGAIFVERSAQAFKMLTTTTTTNITNTYTAADGSTITSARVAKGLHLRKLDTELRANLDSVPACGWVNVQVEIELGPQELAQAVTEMKKLGMVLRRVDSDSIAGQLHVDALLGVASLDFVKQVRMPRKFKFH